MMIIRAVKPKMTGSGNIRCLPRHIACMREGYKVSTRSAIPRAKTEPTELECIGYTLDQEFEMHDTFLCTFSYLGGERMVAVRGLAMQSRLSERVIRVPI